VEVPVARSERNVVLALAVASVVGLVSSPARAENPPPERDVGAFLDLEWRLMGLAEHVSHGPAFSAGATFFDGFLRVGIGGLSRPGPFNPATFDVTIPEGGTYQGQSVVSLRSDGGMAGLHLGLSVPLPLDALAVQMPVTLGYGGFGFYLTGDDRETPDGRRVSEWEDELFDGRDSHIGLVIDVGLRLRYQPKALPGFAPYVGGAYTVVPGFDTIVRRDYAGFSGLLGVEVGLGM
jgi:hypothetical protein